MSSSSISCFLKNPISWMSILGLIPGFFGYGFSSFLLTSILLASSVLFHKFSKQKPSSQVNKSFLENELTRSTSVNQEISTFTEQNIPKLRLISEDESVTEIKKQARETEEQEEKVIISENEYPGRSSTTSEDSEVNYWRLQDNYLFDFSDGSISDEDSLIEIELPSGNYINHCKEDDEEQEDPKFVTLQKKLMPEFVPAESFFKQQYDLMELLTELNEINIEEENLIEIDISMGSIKCPTIEIEA